MKKFLQVVTAVVGVVGTLTGLGGLVLGGGNPAFGALAGGNLPVLDDFLRFYAGVWFGVGIAGLVVAKNFDAEPRMFRAFWLSVLAGGVGRAIALVVSGSPGPYLLTIMTFELFAAVVLALHARLPKA